MMARYNVWIAVVVVAAGTAGCESPSDEAARTGREEDSAPARAAVRVAAGAGIKTEKMSRQDVQEAVHTSGWLAAKPGRQVVIRAPVTGFVGPTDGARPFALGQRCAKDDSVGVLNAFLSPQEQAQLVTAKEDTDTVIKQSLASLEIARAQLARLEQRAASAVPGTRLQELRETVARAEAAQNEALEKLPFLPAEPYRGMPQLRPTAMRAPIDGRIVKVHVAPRQLVLQGEPLWTVADWSSLWVRVPVFVADLPRIVRDAAFTLTVPGTSGVRRAVPVAVPQPTAPGTQTVDIYGQVDNPEWDLRPGQAVAVALPTGRTSPQWTLPSAAILWDGWGDTWVYVRTSPDSFSRRRVQLGPVLAGRAVVRRGLDEDDQVVTVGAEALYGEEFKSELPAEDDD